MSCFDSLGLDTEKYISNLQELEQKELRSYSEVHYLISLDVNRNDQVADFIQQISRLEGVEVDSSLESYR